MIFATISIVIVAILAYFVGYHRGDSAGREAMGQSYQDLFDGTIASASDEINRLHGVIQDEVAAGANVFAALGQMLYLGARMVKEVVLFAEREPWRQSPYTVKAHAIELAEKVRTMYTDVPKNEWSKAEQDIARKAAQIVTATLKHMAKTVHDVPPQSLGEAIAEVNHTPEGE